MKTVVLLNQDQMGHGDVDLSRRILKTFLQKAIAFEGLDAILMVSSGVMLSAAGSPVLGELTMLEEHGVDMVPCGTCLNHYDVEPQVGTIGSMDEIIRRMNKAEKVITI